MPTTGVTIWPGFPCMFIVGDTAAQQAALISTRIRMNTNSNNAVATNPPNAIARLGEIPDTSHPNLRNSRAQHCQRSHHSASAGLHLRKLHAYRLSPAPNTICCCPSSR